MERLSRVLNDDQAMYQRIIKFHEQIRKFNEKPGYVLTDRLGEKGGVVKRGFFGIRSVGDKLKKYRASDKIADIAKRIDTLFETFESESLPILNSRIDWQSLSEEFQKMKQNYFIQEAEGGNSIEKAERIIALHCEQKAKVIESYQRIVRDISPEMITKSQQIFTHHLLTGGYLQSDDVVIKNNSNEIDLEKTFISTRKTIVNNPRSLLNAKLNRALTDLVFLSARPTTEEKTRKDLFVQTKVIMDMGCIPIPYDYSPLLYAVYLGDIDWCRFLLDKIDLKAWQDFKRKGNTLLAYLFMRMPLVELSSNSQSDKKSSSQSDKQSRESWKFFYQENEVKLHFLQKQQQKSEETVLEVLKLLLEKGFDPNITIRKGDSLIHDVVLRGFPDSLKLLLDRGVNVNSLTNAQNTPLHLVFVMETNKVESSEIISKMVGLLLEKGAKQLPNADKNTPLHLGAKTGCVDSVRMLLAASIESVNIENIKNQKPIELAISHGNVGVVRELFDQSDIDSEIYFKYLQIAIRYGHFHVFKFLLNNKKADLKMNSIIEFLMECSNITESAASIFLKLLLENENFQERTLEGLLLRALKTKRETLFFLLLAYLDDQGFSLIEESWIEMKKIINASPTYDVGFKDFINKGISFNLPLESLKDKIDKDGNYLDNYSNEFKDFIKKVISFKLIVNTFKDTIFLIREEKVLFRSKDTGLKFVDHKDIFPKIVEYLEIPDVVKFPILSTQMRKNYLKSINSIAMKNICKSYPQGMRQFADAELKISEDFFKKYSDQHAMDVFTQNTYWMKKFLKRHAHLLTLYLKKDSLGKIDFFATKLSIKRHIQRSPTEDHLNYVLNQLLNEKTYFKMCPSHPSRYFDMDQTVYERKKYVSWVEWILDMGCIVTPHHESPLIYAAYLGDVELFKILFSRINLEQWYGFKINGYSLIMLVVTKATSLPSENQDLDKIISRRLSMKSDESACEILKLLFSKGFTLDVLSGGEIASQMLKSLSNSNNNPNQTVLSNAGLMFCLTAQSQFSLCMKLLLESQGVDIKTVIETVKIGTNTLMHCLFLPNRSKNERKVSEILQMFLKMNFNVKQHPNEEGKLPIHLAIERGYSSSLEDLLRLCGVADIHDKDGKLLELAISCRNKAGLKNLFQVTFMNKDKYFVCLKSTIMNGDLDLFKYLLKQRKDYPVDVDALLLVMIGCYKNMADNRLSQPQVVGNRPSQLQNVRLVLYAKMLLEIYKEASIEKAVLEAVKKQNEEFCFILIDYLQSNLNTHNLSIMEKIKSPYFSRYDCKVKKHIQ
ncbi:MAG: ankyrin repeat domain-containing protein [Chlamydiales bacterium]